MAHFTLTRSVSEDGCCILAYASGECQRVPREVYLHLKAASEQPFQIDRSWHRAITFFNVGWDQLASSAGPPAGNVEKS